jgi:hypothetical protein
MRLNHSPLVLLLLPPLLVCAPARAAVIGIDTRDGSSADFVQATGASFSTFRTTITSMGNAITPLSTFTPASLADLRAIIIRQSSFVAGYSPAEITAIQSFVHNGGGLLIQGEGTSDENVPNLNTLVSPWGVTYAATGTEGTGHTITGFLPHPVTAGLSSIGIDFQRREIAFASPALDLTTGTGADDALAALTGTGGAGNVVLLSDTTLFRNTGAGANRDIAFGSNQLLLQNIVTFITPEPATVPCSAALALLTFRRRTRNGRKY